jgi:hypothetical protein
MEANLMTDKMKELIDKARTDTPPGIECVEDTTTGIPDEHTHALIEEIMDEGNNVLVKILATGDEIGIVWAFGVASEHYDSDNTIGIMDIPDLIDAGEPIEIH